MYTSREVLTWWQAGKPEVAGSPFDEHAQGHFYFAGQVAYFGILNQLFRSHHRPYPGVSSSLPPDVLGEEQRRQLQAVDITIVPLSLASTNPETRHEMRQELYEVVKAEEERMLAVARQQGLIDAVTTTQDQFVFANAGRLHVQLYDRQVPLGIIAAIASATQQAD
jgi:hypothetical protein